MANSNMSNSDLLWTCVIYLKGNERWLSLYRKNGASIIDWQISQPKCDNARINKNDSISDFFPKTVSYFLNV